MVGTTIGSYQILSRLGAGAMGEVYLAEHRHLKRKAAIKFLGREIVGRPDLLERFFLEARATSAIAHAGIVQVFDCEVDPTGRPYIVMELLEGETLAARIASSGALQPVTAARLARSAAEALHAAHAKGIVHRDIKPENIFVQAQTPDAVKLVDFGIAKLAGDFRAGQVHMTRTGAMMGTPLYMSPEQCRDSAKTDFRTDIYSLGCVMFEMLTGHPPFTHELMGDLVVAHMTEAPRNARAVNPAVPPALAELVDELLRKDPAERPADMQVVADRLSSFLASVTTVRGPGGVPVPPGGADASTANAAQEAKARTTFGGTASELVAPAAARARGRRIAIIGACAGVALAAVGILAARGRGVHGADAPPPVAAAPAAVAPPVKAAAPAATPLPAAAAAAAPLPNPLPASGERGTAHGKKHVAHKGAEVNEPPSAGPQLAKADPPPSAAAAEAHKADLSGAWEGPWNDAAHQQQGRLYVQVGGNGAVAGWMFNSGARESYRMTGRLSPDGLLDLVCLCPAQQNFTARGTLGGVDRGELRGRLVLSTAAGAFGQSQVTLHRTAPR